MNRLRAAGLALVLGQALTAWGAIMHVVAGGLSPFVPGFAVAAVAVTLRKTDGNRARAGGAFAAGMLTTSIFAGSLLDAGLLLWGGWPDGSGLPASTLLLLGASILFVMAGAFYWTMDPEPAA